MLMSLFVKLIIHKHANRSHKMVKYKSKRGKMHTPDQKLFIGQLVRATENRWPYLKKGDIGLITYARCHKVCVKGGPTSREGMKDGPKYAMEWAYVGRFSSELPQGVRLNRLSSIEVIA